MIYSYKQVARYLRCHRSYRHHYLDGWREKETRAAMLFGRCFEKHSNLLSKATIAAQLSSRNGVPFAMLRWNTRMPNPPGCTTARALLIDANLIRTAGANDLAWLDELVD
jgi:hypothetical protein